MLQLSDVTHTLKYDCNLMIHVLYYSSVPSTPPIYRDAGSVMRERVVAVLVDRQGGGKRTGEKRKGRGKGTVVDSRGGGLSETE